jgi:hypothetical protein
MASFPQVFPPTPCAPLYDSNYITIYVGYSTMPVSFIAIDNIAVTNTVKL